MISQICWWEYNELIDHLRSRPDIWDTDEVLWIRKNVAGEPAFALAFLPPEQHGPFRMYSLQLSPVEWSEPDCEEYIDNLVFYWTSYSSRLEMERLLIDELKLDPETSFAMAIALQRAQVDPKVDPERLMDPPKQEPLWAWDLPFPPKTGRLPDTVAIAKCDLPSPGGTISITAHGEMLRVNFQITTQKTKNGWHSISMSGWCKPKGYSINRFMELLQRRGQEPIETDDPESQLDFDRLLVEHVEELHAADSDSGRHVTDPDNRRGDGTETVEREVLPGVPPVLRVGEDREPGSESAELAPGLRDGDTQVPGAESAGGNDRGECGVSDQRDE